MALKRATETIRLAEEILVIAGGDEAEAVTLATAVMCYVTRRIGKEFPPDWFTTLDDFPSIEEFHNAARKEGGAEIGELHKEFDDILSEQNRSPWQRKNSY